MSASTADVVICGAGIAGAAAAFHLGREAGLSVVVVDERPPLSLTSDKSTECYRNWWPGPGDDMVRLMNRSIDLLEAYAERSGDRFVMNRRGYLFATGDRTRAAELAAAAEGGAERGVGPLRRHPGAAESYQPHRASGLEGALTGSDLITDETLLRRYFPYLSPRTEAALHVRRCGWLSAQQLGMYWLEEARAAGARLLTGRVTGVASAGGGVSSVQVAVPGGEARIDTPRFVNCAGPFAAEVARLTGAEVPVVCEAHVKISIEDRLGAVARDAPLIIWTDPVALPWSAQERASLAGDPASRYLLEPFAPGVHGRPTGGPDARSLLLYWTYHARASEPVFPIDFDPNYPEIVLRGMSAMVPRLAEYFERIPRPYVDGGYYAKTPENRPLIGPLPLDGAFICAAFSGYGIMASAAAGELLRAHLCGETPAGYAGAFLPSRYQDPAYQALLAEWPDSGEL